MERDQANYAEERREQLETMFYQVLGNDNLYFQPPESIKLKYPCIVYERVSGQTYFADNKPYKVDRRYIATVITEDPDTIIPDELALKEKCTFDRSFVTDNLYHYVFTVY